MMVGVVDEYYTVQNVQLALLHMHYLEVSSQASLEEYRFQNFVVLDFSYATFNMYLDS